MIKLQTKFHTEWDALDHIADLTTEVNWLTSQLEDAHQTIAELRMVAPSAYKEATEIFPSNTTELLRSIGCAINNLNKGITV